MDTVGFYPDPSSLCFQYWFSLFKILAVNVKGYCVGTEFNRHQISVLFCFVFFAKSLLVGFCCSCFGGYSVLFVCFVLCYLIFFSKSGIKKTLDMFL